MKFIKQALFASVITSGLIAGAVQAQTAPKAAPANAAAAAAQQTPVSDEQVSEFVDAYVAVQTLNQKYTAKLKATKDKDAAKKLQQKAQNEMRKAITDKGLTLTEYKEIAQQANKSEALRKRITDILSGGPKDKKAAPADS